MPKIIRRLIWSSSQCVVQKGISSHRFLVCVSNRFSIVFITVLLVATLACIHEPAQAFEGTVFTKIEPTFDFELKNQFGEMTSLDDHHGKVILLTFLYTDCRDVCPIVTAQLKTTFDALGDLSDQVVFFIVSLDPKGDSIETVYDYLDRRGLVNDWFFVVGSFQNLKPIWTAYYVSPIDSRDSNSNSVVRRIPQNVSATDSLSQQISKAYLITHSAPVYLIDRNNYRRVVFTSPLDPIKIAHDIRLLLDN